MAQLDKWGGGGGREESQIPHTNTQSYKPNKKVLHKVIHSCNKKGKKIRSVLHPCE